MGKITFRADDELVAELEAFDASKSEVMREALRTYLEANARTRSHANGSRSTRDAGSGSETLDELLCDRIDTILEQRLSRHNQDVNVTVTLEGAATTASAHQQPSPAVDTPQSNRQTQGQPRKHQSERLEAGETCTCGQCGSTLEDDHVFCPNCGEKATNRVFCECGDEVRSDWGFCPSCGRRTPAADVLESRTQ